MYSIQQNHNFFYSFLIKKRQLDNTINLISKKNTLINVNYSSIKFLFEYFENENKKLIDDGKQPLKKEEFIYNNIEFLSKAKNQINKYMSDIETLNKVAQNLNRSKNIYLSKSYNQNINLSKQYHKIFIGISEKDKNQYYAIDKRQTIFKDDYIKFAYIQYLKHNITIKEFRKFSRYGIMSENLKQRIQIYNTHVLNKISCKKNKLHKSKYTHKEYIYIPKYKRLIRFKKYSDNNVFDLFTNEAIYNEIENKKRFESNLKNLYSYSKL